MAIVDIHEMIHRFRLSSSEVFNHFFRVLDPYNNNVGWILFERFSAVETILFQKLVTEPASLSNIGYGEPQVEIVVELSSNCAPAMINRDIDSGYWDHPIKEVDTDARLCFVGFFNWDQLDYRDNHYVRVQIDHWPAHPEAIGKHALIESQYAQFTLRSQNRLKGPGSIY